MPGGQKPLCLLHFLGVLNSDDVVCSRTQLDKILAAQTRQSELDDTAEPVHDEHLFIITHQSMHILLQVP